MNTANPLIFADLSDRNREAASAFLAAQDTDWERHVSLTGRCLHASKPAREPYEALVRAIAYQQLHARAAEAILERLLALFPTETFPSPATVLATSDELLRLCGFSARKVGTIKGIARARIAGVIPDRETARLLSDETLIKRLVSLHGVGRWTVEMLLIYTLERSDILPVDDFGVREGYRRLKKFDTAPTPKVMRLIGEQWRPFRTFATWYLWQVPSDKKILTETLPLQTLSL